MGREVKRVPEQFGWPLGTVWEGYLMPEYLELEECPDCESGYSPEAQRFFNQWYGYEPFNPADTGSKPFTFEHEAVQAFARRNIESAPQYYGSGSAAVDREAARLASMWDTMWMHHLGEGDVAALIHAGRLHDFTHNWQPGSGWVEKNPTVLPTPEEVNVWSLRGFGHDSINASICVTARAEREGVLRNCATCEGHHAIEAWVGQRAAADAWEGIDPPTGDWWQMWETVSEGSPKTPAFATAAELAEHLHRNPDLMGPGPSGLSLESALKWVEGSAWIPSGIIDSSGVKTGAQLVEDQ